MLFPLVLLSVCACEHACMCVSSHVRDSPLILSLDSCLHAYFLYVTILSVTHRSETAARLPITCPLHHPTGNLTRITPSLSCLFGRCLCILWKMPLFSVEDASVFLIPPPSFGLKTMLLPVLAARSIFGLAICQTGATGATPKQQDQFEGEQLGCSSGGPSWR